MKKIDRIYKKNWTVVTNIFSVTQNLNNNFLKIMNSKKFKQSFLQDYFFKLKYFLCVTNLTLLWTKVRKLFTFQDCFSIFKNSYESSENVSIIWSKKVIKFWFMTREPKVKSLATFKLKQIGQIRALPKGWFMIMSSWRFWLFFQ